MHNTSLVVSNRHEVSPHAVTDTAGVAVTISAVVAHVVSPEVLHYGVP